MPELEVTIADREVATPPPVPSARMSHATWRFMGDRDAADQAYCVRFAVSQAPEPIIALGGAWAYALPSEQPM